MTIVQVISDWLHLLATVIWIGGMFFNLVVLMPSLTAIDPPPMRGKLMGAIVNRFIPIAWGAVVVLVVTGIFNTTNRLPSPAALFTTTYGNLLLVKHLLVVAMIVIGAIVSFVLGPKLMAPVPSASPAAGPGQSGAAGVPPAPPPQLVRLQNQLRNLGITNVVLGILMLLVAVALRRM